jgi:hypothetical protein
MGEKYKLTLYGDRELVKRMRIQALEEGRSVSAIVEDLMVAYLKSVATKKTQKGAR